MVSTGCSDGGASSLLAQKTAARPSGGGTSARAPATRAAVARERKTVSTAPSDERQIGLYLGILVVKDQNALIHNTMDPMPLGAKRSFASNLNF